ncbi:hypothetical protein SLS60_000637 [Paraconiothyrium brasiliense]|uniref:Tail specific protease domain-containing protein n=1 Tax=Paraconiothyrium brasiliense TaxID=300254 RepID=A0ABR3S6U5_9PLEO
MAITGVYSNLGANNVEPCTYIATLQSQDSLSFPAGSSFDCLNSVPVDVEGDKKLIDELKIAWQWHSDITWLKNPPIKNNLESFESEYQVQLAIQQITVRSGDYHLNNVPDILQVFHWRRDVSLVALSKDGVVMPKLYVAFDALKVADGIITQDKIPDVLKINNNNETWPYLENLAQWEQYRDTDGRLNSLWAKGDTLTPGAFMAQSWFDGAGTNITFANGTIIEFINTAWTNEDFTDVRDGTAHAGDNDQGIWKPQYKGKLGEAAVIPKGEYHSSRLHKRETVPARFPAPIVDATSGAVAGYFLEGEGYNDVAVLKIITFDPKNDEYSLEFQEVISQFLRLCQTAGKNRLIMDLRENGGGSLQLLLDTFRQLFPHRNLWQGSRYRANPHFKLIGDAMSEIYSNDTMHDYYKEMWNGTINEHYRYWGYSHFLDVQDKDFESREQLKGPELFHDNQYTNDDEIQFSILPIPPTARQSSITLKSSCLLIPSGSACTSIHEELKNNAGIRSVIVGGRDTEGPIQAVAGTKGGEVIPLMRAIEQADHMRNISLTFDLKAYPAHEATLDELIDTLELRKRAGRGMTIFYTHESFADPDDARKQVWDAFLVPENKCVKGSTGHKSSISGGFVPYGPWAMKHEDLPVPQSKGTNDTSEVVDQKSPTPTEYEGTERRMGASVMAMCVTVAVIMAQS